MGSKLPGVEPSLSLISTYSVASLLACVAAEWIDKILGVERSLEAYEVQYNTTVGQADDFFSRGPWSLDVPQSVADDCFDVILVDAPQGYSKELPGEEVFNFGKKRS